MPKVAHDFKNEIIFYIIKCNDLEKTDIYVGSTFSFVKRKSQHKSDCSNINSHNHNYKIYVYIRENGGWDAFTMTMLDRKVCVDMLEARKHEQTLITQYKAELNMRKAFRNEKECRKQYELEHKEDKQKYRIENAEKIQDYQKQYYIENTDKLNNYQKKHRFENIDKIKEKLKRKITCECGCIVSHYCLTNHKKSQKHAKLMELKNASIV